MHNSYAYDFGITSKPKPAQVDALIEDLKVEFDLVLITEYFDMSLILLKREFCWELEDILHYSLKVTSKKAHHQVADAKTTKQIKELNWADVKIYDAMNKTFWKKMEQFKDDPTFEAEVKQLQDGRAQITENCKKWLVHYK